MDGTMFMRFQDLATDIYIAYVRDGKTIVGKYNNGEYDLKIIDTKIIPPGYILLSLHDIENTRQTYATFLTLGFLNSMDTYIDDATR